MWDLAKDAPIEVLDEIIIVGHQQRAHFAWPALGVAANGDLVLAYKEASDHNVTDDGVIWLARSTDQGQTWPFKKPLVAIPGWSCITSHGMTCLSDGTLLLHATQSRHYHDAADQRRRELRAWFTRSLDNGKSWDQRGPELEPPFTSHTRRCTTYGRVQELGGGRLMVPVYGVPRGETDDRLRVAGMAFSQDRGRSWPDFVVFYEDRKGDINPSETDVVRLPDGRLLAMIRANSALRLYRSYSDDEGQTWSPIEPTELPGQCPALIYLASGDILCAYRDMRPGHLGMSCGLSHDLGQSWTPLGHLYLGANRDCAYPSMVHLPGGRIYCVFYTAAQPEAVTGTCEIHGLILRDRTWS